MTPAFTSSLFQPATHQEPTRPCLPCIIGGSIALLIMIGIAAGLIWGIARMWFG